MEIGIVPVGPFWLAIGLGQWWFVCLHPVFYPFLEMNSEISFVFLALGDAVRVTRASLSRGPPSHLPTMHREDSWSSSPEVISRNSPSAGPCPVKANISTRGEIIPEVIALSIF